MSFARWMENCGAVQKCAIAAFVVLISFLSGKLIGSIVEVGSGQTATSETPRANVGNTGETQGSPTLVSSIARRTQSPFAVPEPTLEGMKFKRFDEGLRVTEEACTILRISDSEADRLQVIAQRFLPTYRESQAQRIRRSKDFKFATYEIVPASEAEASRLKREFAEDVAGIVGGEKARHLPFPIEINTGNVYQVFHVVKPEEPGAVRIEVGEIEREKGVSINISFGEQIRLQPGEPMPERWRHLLALEDVAEGEPHR